MSLSASLRPVMKGLKFSAGRIHAKPVIPVKYCTLQLDMPLQWKIAPALAAGNTIVLKPSEMASVNCLELGEIATKAGLPQGVLNVVSGLGTEAGAALRYAF